MSIPNVEHLLEQADRLITPTGPGAPRQVDLRRAISNSYYALFHAVSIAGADQFVGKARQSEPQYALVYRSIDHRALKQLCEGSGKANSSGKIRALRPWRLSPSGHWLFCVCRGGFASQTALGRL